MSELCVTTVEGRQRTTTIADVVSSDEMSRVFRPIPQYNTLFGFKVPEASLKTQVIIEKSGVVVNGEVNCLTCPGPLPSRPHKIVGKVDGSTELESNNSDIEKMHITRDIPADAFAKSGAVPSTGLAWTPIPSKAMFPNLYNSEFLATTFNDFIKPCRLLPAQLQTSVPVVIDEELIRDLIWRTVGSSNTLSAIQGLQYLFSLYHHIHASPLNTSTIEELACRLDIKENECPTLDASDTDSRTSKPIDSLQNDSSPDEEQEDLDGFANDDKELFKICSPVGPAGSTPSAEMFNSAITEHAKEGDDEAASSSSLFYEELLQSSIGVATRKSPRRRLVAKYSEREASTRTDRGVKRRISNSNNDTEKKMIKTEKEATIPSIELKSATFQPTHETTPTEMKLVDVHPLKEAKNTTVKPEKATSTRSKVENNERVTMEDIFIEVGKHPVIWDARLDTHRMKKYVDRSWELVALKWKEELTKKQIMDFWNINAKWLFEAVRYGNENKRFSEVEEWSRTNFANFAVLRRTKNIFKSLLWWRSMRPVFVGFCAWV